MDIDYVITWVNGQDPGHQALRRQFAPVDHKAQAAIQPVLTAQYEARFSDDGEIYYNIASVLKYAPFIRRVFIVTDHQKPEYLDAFAQEGLCDKDFLQIVSHDTVFAGLDAVRPSFNSLAIEAVLWRIPGLCEHFVYGNDDYFINAPLQRQDFFRNGLPVLRGVWQTAEDKRLKHRIRQWLGWQNNRPSYKAALWKGAVLAGMHDRYLNVHHHLHALRKSTFADFFAQHHAVLKRQLSFRYRDREQFNPVSLANHLEIVRHGVKPIALEGIAYINNNKSGLRQLDMIRQSSVPFGCVQGLGGYAPSVRARLHQVFTDKFADVLPDAVKQMLSAHSAA